METGLKGSSYKTFLLGPLHIFYKLVLNPFLRATSPIECSCKFLPSCSVYAKEAFQNHGFVFAAHLVLLRIIKCHPFSGTGFILDPVPCSESLNK